MTTKNEDITVRQAWEDFVDTIGYNRFIWWLIDKIKMVLCAANKSFHATQKDGKEK